MFSLETHLALTLLIPLLGGIGVFLFGSMPNLRESATLGAAALLFLNVLVILQSVLSGTYAQVDLIDTLPGLGISLKVEPLGMIFACVASTLWIINSLYSIGYMRGNKEANQTRFYICFTIAISAAMGIAFAENLLTLFIFYEVLSLSTYPLVTHKGNDAALKGGRIYLGILLGTSIGLFLPAIIWVWTVTGTTDFTAGGILAGHVGAGMTASCYFCLCMELARLP
nr:proton-conducting transporter membrane subunit [Sneathiella glossodoripedis]